MADKKKQQKTQNKMLFQILWFTEQTQEQQVRMYASKTFKKQRDVTYSNFTFTVGEKQHTANLVNSPLLF